jgi:hypothetical protein
VRAPKADSHSTTTAKSPPKNKTRAIPDCPNPECSLKHLLKDCANTTKDRKDELYEELAERRKTQGEQRATRSGTAAVAAVPSTSSSKILERAPPLGSPSAKAIRAGSSPPSGRIKISFQSVLDAIALPDSGAEYNVIPRSLVQKLEDSGVFVPERTLKKPVRIELAVQGPWLQVGNRYN